MEAIQRFARKYNIPLLSYVFSDTAFFIGWKFFCAFVCLYLLTLMSRHCLFVPLTFESLSFPAPGPLLGPRPWPWPPICIYRPWPPICNYRPWPPICIYQPWPSIFIYRPWPPPPICIYHSEVLKKSQKENLCMSLCSNKVADLQPGTFFEKGLCTRVFQ